MNNLAIKICLISYIIYLSFKERNFKLYFKCKKYKYLWILFKSNFLEYWENI